MSVHVSSQSFCQSKIVENDVPPFSFIKAILIYRQPDVLAQYRSVTNEHFAYSLAGTNRNKLTINFIDRRASDVIITVKHRHHHGNHSWGQRLHICFSTLIIKYAVFSANPYFVQYLHKKKKFVQTHSSDVVLLGVYLATSF